MLPGKASSIREKAEDTLDEGIEFLEIGDEEEAGWYFQKSIEIDPSYADGYTHLGNIAWRKGNWEEAETLYLKAKDCAKPEIQNIPEGSFWGILESRPYMRALHGLGLTAWKLDRLEEAETIFKKMLELNPNDNQGVRYLAGPLYHQMGKLEEACKWYKQNSDDPNNLYNYGLALIQQNELKKAMSILIFAVSSNPYIAPLLLGEDLPDTDWWHGTNWAEPEYAVDYVMDYGEWWDLEDLPLEVLEAVWWSMDLQKTLKDYIATRRALQKAENAEDRVSLGRAGDNLFAGEKVRKMSAKIFKQFEMDTEF